MNTKKQYLGYAAAVGMIILILDGKTASEGALDGIALCIKSVIPSLFPFFILTFLLTSALRGMTLRILVPIRIWCRLPAGSDAILISGYLGGYPVGAQCIAQTFQAGGLSKEDAQRMLGFCNNAGPAFLFGIVGSMFSKSWMIWVLWGIHIASSLIVARILPGFGTYCHTAPSPSFTLSDALTNAIRVMALVCGWVVLFRVILHFLNRWVLWICPVILQVAITGMLELSNGCFALHQIADESLRFLLASGLLASGGLCVTMQTASVARGLSLRYYYLGKALQTIFSLIFSWAVIFKTIFPLFLLLPAIPLLYGKKQKKYSFPKLIRV